MSERITVDRIRAKKRKGERISVLTAYDALTARAIDQAGIDVILVGDTLGEVFQGHETTVPVKMDHAVYHTEIVARSAKRALVVGDMPFMSYTLGLVDTCINAGRLVQDAGATAVKLEGGVNRCEVVRRIIDCGIPVMGHVGLLPASINTCGVYKIQGKTLESGRAVLEDALALEEAGAFAVVLETVTASLAKVITERLEIPTIGIGSGPHCDGQVLVTPDILGYETGRTLKFVRQYDSFGERMLKAFEAYGREVAEGAFPDESTTFEEEDVDWSRL
jgi:3-methyl-2-oxobutanoate hydroxymethyltransferase